MILSAGAINSPQILMLSGIGPAEELYRHDIDVIADLPVGRNMQDHLFFPGVFYRLQLILLIVCWGKKVIITNFPGHLIDTMKT